MMDGGRTVRKLGNHSTLGCRSHVVRQELAVVPKEIGVKTRVHCELVIVNK